MNQQSMQNKKAWEYRAYEFRNSEHSPSELADILKKEPERHLRMHGEYFQDVRGKRIANLCGSCGKRAVPLALLGAQVTVFDISEEQKRYAMELADAAGVVIEYVCGDVYDIELSEFGGRFDMVYMEGGVLHYFNDMEQLAGIWFSLLKKGGRMVLSDFHPCRFLAGNGNFTAGSCLGKGNVDKVKVNRGTGGFDYFDSSVKEGEVAYKYLLGGDLESYPKCSLTRHTLSEIMNCVIGAGFTVKRFDEHPDWGNRRVPGEFTVIADVEGER